MNWMTEALKTRYPQNAVITDRLGNPSVMVYIEAFYLDDVIDGAPHVPHPAFVRDGRVQSGVYVSKFQNVVLGSACSLPDNDPATRISFDEAVAACAAKGDGFHLMTADEWGAIALWCQKNGWLPYGNNELGKDVREETVTARIAYFDREKPVCRTACGTGPVEWSHNRKPDGIYDLNGNIWEWMGGIRLVYGEVQILSAGTSNGYDQGPMSAGWRAIDGTNGESLIPDGNGTTKNSVKLDFADGCWRYVTGSVANSLDKARFCSFADVCADTSVGMAAKMRLYALGCLPVGAAKADRSVSFYANNGNAERMAFRGGRWGQGLDAGVFKTCFDDPRSFSGDAVGFRSAYYKP